MVIFITGSVPCLKLPPYFAKIGSTVNPPTQSNVSVLIQALLYFKIPPYVFFVCVCVFPIGILLFL